MKRIGSLEESSNPDEIMQKVLNAIALIQNGACKRVDVAKDIKVYECKDVIRVDFNMKEV